jgi:hypothetical protein
MRGSAGALLETVKNPTIAYGRGAVAALAAARAAPRTMHDGAETRLPATAPAVLGSRVGATRQAGIGQRRPSPDFAHKDGARYLQTRCRIL